MVAYNISADDVMEALNEQSLEASPGRTGESSGKLSQSFEYVIKYPGRFTKEEEYKNIIVKANSNGEFVRLKDIADIEFGSEVYDIYSTLNGKSSAAITIKQSYGSNASEVIKNVKELMATLETVSYTHLDVYKRQSLASLMIVLLALSCSEEKVEKTENTVYPVTTPYKTNAEITKDYVAQIQSAKNIEIRAQEKGFLQKIYVDEGQFVKAGQPMFQIMPQILQAEVMKAKAEVDQSVIELENATKLATNNVVSRNEQRMAKAKLDAARAELKLAQTKLSFTTIRAPFSGIINRIPLKLGSLADEGDLLTSLSDNSGIYAYFNLSEPEYLNYQTHLAERGDQQVALVMANGELFPEKGVIQNIEGEFDNETGNIAFLSLIHI